METYQNRSLFAGSLIVPSLSGDIFVFRAGGSEGGENAGFKIGLHKLPIAARELVGLAPFIAEDGVLYLGEKTSQYLLLDPRTGEKERVYNRYYNGLGAAAQDDRIKVKDPTASDGARGPHAADPHVEGEGGYGGGSAGTEGQGGWEGGWERGRGGGSGGAGGLGGGGKIFSREKILLGRQDYRVAAVDSMSGGLSWNASFAVVSVHVVGGAPGAAVPGAGAEAPRPVRVVATQGGAAHCVDMHSGEWLWTAHLSAPAVRALATHPGQVVEVEVVASTAAQDKHFEDQVSLQLRASDFLYAVNNNFLCKYYFLSLSFSLCVCVFVCVRVSVCVCVCVYIYVYIQVSMKLRASDYQYVAVSNGQVYATGAAIAAPPSTPLLTATPHAQTSAGHAGVRMGVGGETRGEGGRAGVGGGMLVIWEPEAGHACVPGSTARILKKYSL